MGVNEKNWPRRSFKLDQVDFLNRNAKYAEWRGRSRRSSRGLIPFSMKTRGGGDALAWLWFSRPRNCLLVPDRLWTRLKGRRVALESPLNSAVHIAPLLAMVTQLRMTDG